jgi:hypothetical protein
MKTAVEWLEENIQIHYDLFDIMALISQAKKMEKEQIIDSYLCGDSNGCGCYEWSTEEEALEWFNEQYNEVQNKKG